MTLNSRTVFPPLDLACVNDMTTVSVTCTRSLLQPTRAKRKESFESLLRSYGVAFI